MIHLVTYGSVVILHTNCSVLMSLYFDYLKRFLSAVIFLENYMSYYYLIFIILFCAFVTE